MKRSSKAKLILMAQSTTIALSSMALTGCEEAVNAHVFKDVQQCSAFYSQSFCQDEMNKAKANHNQHAPKYLNKKDCEEDFGEKQCESRGGSGSFFYVPYMQGYMTSSYAGQPSQLQTQPLYKAKDDPSAYRMANNEVVSRSTGQTRVYPSSTLFPKAGTTVTRGGFGSTAAAKMSSGG